MSFAPILDPSYTSSRTEPLRRKSLAAGQVLRHMAEGDASILRAAIQLLEEKESPGDLLKCKPVDPAGISRRVFDLLGEQQLHEVSGLDPAEVLPRLIEQLRQVKAFGELDGGHLR